MGNVLTATGPRTDVTQTTTYTYDSDGNLETVENALGHVTEITTYNNRGLPLSFTDPNGVVTDLTYDVLGRLKTRTVNAAGGDAVTTFDYDLAGLLTQITLPDGSELHYEYDDAQRLVAVSNTGGERIEYTLDSAGNITESFTKTSGGTIVRELYQTFDDLGRMIEMLGASAPQVTAYGYDANGNRTSVTDARSNATAYAFDALNRLITVTDALSHSASTVYNSQDSVTSQSDFRTLATTYVYDGFGRVIQASSPDTGTTVFYLDKAGNVTSETDARGIVTNRTFDALDRVTEIAFPASGGEDMNFTYDATAGGNFGIGRLTGFMDETGSTGLTYDERGNVIEDARVIGTPGTGYTTTYAYDLADNLIQITYPSGRIVYFDRDAEGRIEQVSTRPSAMGSLTTLADDVTYKPFGPLASFTFGNGLDHSRSYDNNYWLTGLITEDGTTDIQDLSFGYDDAGNLTGITDNLNSGRTQAFEYDALNRLEEATGAYGTINYTYDNNSNRLTRAISGGITQTSTIASASNRLTSISDGTNTRSFTYTAVGNAATDNRATSPDLDFLYGHRNRLSELKEASATKANYQYNALGQRLVKIIAGSPDVETHYHFDQSGRLIAESDDAGNVIREYVWLDDLPLAQIESSGSIYYVHTDQLGASQKMTDASQNIVWDRQQEPYGEDYSTSGTADSRLRFPGQFADAEDGLNYNYFRDYDPTLGRYIEADPIGLEGGLNLYGYVRQTPQMLTDPTGEIAQGIGMGVGMLCLRNPSCARTIGRFGVAVAGAAGMEMAGWTPSDKAQSETRGDEDAQCPEPPQDEQEWCRQVKEQCIQQCSDTTLPTFDFGWKWTNCYNQCMKDAGCRI